MFEKQQHTYPMIPGKFMRASRAFRAMRVLAFALVGLTVGTMGLTAPPLRRPAPALLRDRDATWSNPQGSVLTPVHDDVWLIERPFYPRLPGLTGTDVGCKSVVVRLPDGTLWVHAPVGLDDALRSALAELGPVRHIVTPNTEHQKFAPAWIIEYPLAMSWACPSLREKKPEVGWRSSLDELLDASNGLTSVSPPSAWGGVLQLCWIKDKVPLSLGVPFFNEVVFCHTPSQTLIVTDLWWNYPGSREDVEGRAADVPLSTRLWKGGMDKIYRPVYNTLMRTPTCAQSYDTILSWVWDYIAPCHGEPVATDGKRVLREHLSL